MIYIWAKKGHLFFVAMTVLLFNLRYWMLFAKPEKPLPGVLKVLPHLNDTTLLFTGLWIMTIAHWTPFGNANWLGVKLLLVVAYVLVGMKALKSKPRSTQAWLFYLLSMGIVGIIYWLATYKPFEKTPKGRLKTKQTGFQTAFPHPAARHQTADKPNPDYRLAAPPSKRTELPLKRPGLPPPRPSSR